MFFWAFLLSVQKYQQISYHPAFAELLSLRLQLMLLPQQSLYPHNPQCISLSPHCMTCLFPILSPQRAAFSDPSCAMLSRLSHFPSPNWCCLHSLDEVVVWIDLFFAIFGRWEWLGVSFHGIDHCILFWFCWWVRCWMLQDIDHMEASCVLYVKVGMLGQLEQSKICMFTVTSLGIAMLTKQHELIFSVSFMWNPGNVLRQVSTNIFSVV